MVLEKLKMRETSEKQDLYDYLLLVNIFFFFLPFLGLLSQHMYVPRLGVELEL